MVKAHWVKKEVGSADYKSKYAHHSSYYKLSNFGRGREAGIEVGFVIGLKEGEDIPRECVEMSEDELRLVQLDRELKNIFPQPFEVVVSQKTIRDEEDKLNIESELMKMKEALKQSKIIR